MLEFISIKGIFFGLIFWAIFTFVGTINFVRSKIKNTQVGLKFSTHFTAGGFMFIIVIALFSSFFIGIAMLLATVLTAHIYPDDEPKKNASTENDEDNAYDATSSIKSKSSQFQPKKKFARNAKKSVTN